MERRSPLQERCADHPDLSPLRYAHNPAEIVDLKDITATVTLVKGVIEEFGNGW